MVLDFPLLLFSEGKCIFSSFKVLKSSFWVFALADCSLLRGAHEQGTRASQKLTRSHQCRHAEKHHTRYNVRACTLHLTSNYVRYAKDANLQPLVEGLSCSELTRLKALELLGGEGL